MGVLKHDNTVTNLDALTAIQDTNANGFGPETTSNPDMVAGEPFTQHGMAWNRGYFSRDIRSSTTGIPQRSLGRDGKLPAGNATLPGVTTR